MSYFGALIPIPVTVPFGAVNLKTNVRLCIFFIVYKTVFYLYDSYP